MDIFLNDGIEEILLPKGVSLSLSRSLPSLSLSLHRTQLEPELIPYMGIMPSTSRMIPSVSGLFQVYLLILQVVHRVKSKSANTGAALSPGLVTLFAKVCLARKDCCEPMG